MSPQPAARIDVGCEESADEYRFFVRDTEPGIRAEDRDKVFRLFMRLCANSIAGDGVGLTAVHKIIATQRSRVGRFGIWMRQHFLVHAAAQSQRLDPAPCCVANVYRRAG